MELIGGFILSLCAASAASVLVGGILPDTSTKKYVNYIISLTLIVVLLMPLKSVISAVPSIIENGISAFDSEDAAIHTSSIVARHIRRAVAEKFSLSEGDVQSCYDGDMLILRVKKRLGIIGSDVVEYVRDRFLVESEVELYE